MTPPPPTFADEFAQPLASILGDFTEEVSAHTNQTLGGLIQATLGNAVEIVVSIQALYANQIRVVQVRCPESPACTGMFCVVRFDRKQKHAVWCRRVNVRPLRTGLETRRVDWTAGTQNMPKYDGKALYKQTRWRRRTPWLAKSFPRVLGM